MDRFLTELSYELIYTPHSMPAGVFKIRDINDYPVLYSAIIGDVDIFVTGDKDFEGIDIERPEIMTPSEFVSRFMQ